MTTPATTATVDAEGTISWPPNGLLVTDYAPWIQKVPTRRRREYLESLISTARLLAIDIEAFCSREHQEPCYGHLQDLACGLRLMVEDLAE